MDAQAVRNDEHTWFHWRSLASTPNAKFGGASLWRIGQKLKRLTYLDR